MGSKSGQPLAGIRVLDFSHVLAGPMCSRLLVDLGADVLRVESSRRVDTPWRSTSDPELSRTYAYVMVHRGKKSITIDLKTEEGGEIARKLASVADVVVENFSAGVMNRLGLSYETLSSINPSLIYLSMSGYGHNGPRQHWTSMNSNLQAYSGLMMVTDEEGEPPVSISNSWMDYVVGLHGCFSVLQALIQRRVNGRGCNIDLAQFECGVGTLGSVLLSGIVSGVRPPRVGCRSNVAAPQGCYPCEGDDQWCVISVENNEQWQALAKIVRHPDWLGPGYELLVDRRRRHNEIDRVLSEWTRARSPHEVEAKLRAAGVAVQRMRRMDEILGEDETGVFHLADGSVAPILLTGLPFAFSSGDKQSFGKAPRLGEHTDSALTEWLGLGAPEIASLRRAGALS